MEQPTAELLIVIFFILLAVAVVVFLLGGIRMVKQSTRTTGVRMMGVAAALAVVGVLALIGGGTLARREVAQETVPAPPAIATGSASEWYIGGTLHQKAVKDWRTASSRDRLATCADFVMAVGKLKQVPSDLKERAADLEACISKGTEGSGVDDKPVSEIAAVCMVLMERAR